MPLYPTVDDLYHTLENGVVYLHNSDEVILVTDNVKSIKASSMKGTLIVEKEDGSFEQYHRGIPQVVSTLSDGRIPSVVFLAETKKYREIFVPSNFRWGSTEHILYRLLCWDLKGRINIFLGLTPHRKFTVKAEQYCHDSKYCFCDSCNYKYEWSDDEDYDDDFTPFACKAPPHSGYDSDY